MKNTCPFYIVYVFEVLKVLLIFLAVLGFTSANMIFHKFLELHSTLSEKKDFRHKFSFFNGFTQTPLLP